MANIIDYVHWRGDIPFYQVPLGEVDALILSYLAYLPFDGLVSSRLEEADVLLRDAARELLLRAQREELPLAFSQKDDKRLLAAIIESRRFGDMRLCGFVNRFDKEREEQFSAVVFLPPDGPAVISLRGTDRTVVGWKEDFNMSYAGEVPAQRTALLYTQRVVSALDTPVVLCGHSKGGNLAAYAAIFSGESTQERIVCVYNFDGPGFNEEVIASPEFGRIDMRIHVFVPQSSMVGILMWHSEPFTIVKSESVSVFQHLPYHWQVMGGRLLTAPELSGDSHLADVTLKRWLRSLTPELRRRVIDGIFSVLSASDGTQIAQLFEPRSVMAILRAAGDMDRGTREALVEAFRLLGDTLMETVPDFIEQRTDQLWLRAGREKNAALPQSEEMGERENGEGMRAAEDGGS